MKKIFNFLFVLFLFFITSCNTKKINNSEEAFNYIKALKNYAADIRVTFKNERNEESLFLKQYSSEDNSYRLDLENERTYIYKDNKIYVKDLKNNAEYFLEEEFDEIYKYCFLNEYIKLIYSMDEVTYFDKKLDTGEVEYFAAKVNLPTNNLNMNYAILYIDANKFIPIKLEIYDSKENNRVLIEYLTFEVVEKDLSLFNIN